MKIDRAEEELAQFREAVGETIAVGETTTETSPPGLPAMNCSVCGNEMVDGRFFIIGQATAVAAPIDAAINRWLGNVKTGARTQVSNSLMKVCYHCGAIQLFAADPSIFRPKETRSLPRSADESHLETDTLPRPAEHE